MNTFPGSLHITATVNTTGPCAGFGTITDTVITLTLPTGFKFDVTGASPAAHVFVGPAVSGFDFHNPTTLAEVTSLIPKPVVSDSGQTVTVNLSALDLGQGTGVIPSSDTIYVRAHSVFSGSSVPADGTQYVFGTRTTSTLTGIGSTTDSSSQTVTASSACVKATNRSAVPEGGRAAPALRCVCATRSLPLRFGLNWLAERPKSACVGRGRPHSTLGRAADTTAHLPRRPCP